MVAENKKVTKVTELVVRIRPLNGKDGIEVIDVVEALAAKEADGKARFSVREVEGGTLDAEIVAQTCRQVLHDTIYAPLTHDTVKKLQDIDEAWGEVKAKVEPLLQGKHAQCPSCGAHALTGAFTDGVKFICPSCEAKLHWKFLKNEKHPDGGMYVLVP